MTRPRNIWDPIWGQVEIGEHEWALIATPAFQRLRRVHQLGMTMLVFPGATHTRFDHSIGVCHTAGLMGGRLVQLFDSGEKTARFTETDLATVRVAGLLHDLGHGPFSHVSDPFLGDKGHERIGAAAVRQVQAVRQPIESAGLDPERIADLIEGSGRRTVERDIVSGPTDADKIDYLLRDSHFTGVRQGLFDHSYLIDQVVSIESVRESLLGFRWGAIWAVEGMKLARHHMHRTVYGHRNRVVTDLMLRRGIAHAIEERLLPADMLTIPTYDEFGPWFDEYCSWDDWRVLSTVAAAPSSSMAGRIFRRLRDHDLLKVLVFLDGEEFKRALGVEHARLLAAAPSASIERLALSCEAPLAAELGVAVEELIVHLSDPRHVLYRDAVTTDLDEDINLVTPSGDVEPLTDRSELFSSLPSQRWRRQLIVYAAVGKRDEPLAERATSATLNILRTKLEEGRD